MNHSAQSLAILEVNGLIHPARFEPELEYIFKHALVQEASYSSLLRADKKNLHRAVAEIIEQYSNRLEEFSGVLAYHYELAGDDKKAVEYSLLAGENALKQFALSAAQPLFEKSAQIARTHQWKAELSRACGGLGEIHRLQGENEKSIAAFNEAIENTTSHQLRGYYFMQMAQTYHLNLYQFDHSLENYKKAEEEFLLDPDSGKLGRLYTYLGYYHAILPVPENESVGLAYLEKARGLLESTHHHNDLAFNYAYTALAYCYLEPALGIEWGARADAICKKYGLSEPNEIACIAMAHAHRFNLDFEQAIYHYEQALEYNRTTGYVFARAITRANLAQTLIAFGRPSAALDSLKISEEHYLKLKHASAVTWVKPLHSIALRELGRPAEADAELEAALVKTENKARIYYRLIETYVMMKRFATAFEILEKHRAEFSPADLNSFKTDLTFRYVLDNPKFKALIGDL